jgi:hypothetical protein
MHVRRRARGSCAPPSSGRDKSSYRNAYHHSALMKPICRTAARFEPRQAHPAPTLFVHQAQPQVCRSCTSALQPRVCYQACRQLSRPPRPPARPHLPLDSAAHSHTHQWHSVWPIAAAPRAPRCHKRSGQAPHTVDPTRRPIPCCRTPCAPMWPPRALQQCAPRTRS